MTIKSKSSLSKFLVRSFDIFLDVPFVAMIENFLTLLPNDSQRCKDGYRLSVAQDMAKGHLLNRHGKNV